MPIVREFRARTVVEETWAKVICNACGKEGEPYGGARKGDKVIPGGFNLIRLTGGYGDDFPGDCETIEAVICSECTEAWAETWKSPPDTTGSWMAATIYSATHTETGETWSVMNGVCWPGGEDDDQSVDWDADHPDQDQRFFVYQWRDTIWKHFKGNLYQVMHVVEGPGGEFLVFYRPLYGEDRYFLRPAVMWIEEISRDGYEGLRFEPVEEF